MNVDATGWMQVQGPSWRALEALLVRVEAQGLPSLSLEETRELARLYRRASGDLLFARAREAPAELTTYLNDLVGRAYAVTSPGSRFRLRDVWHFYARTFPAAVRREIWMIVAAASLLVAGGAFGWLGMAFDPDAAPYLVPEQHLSLDPDQRVASEAKGGVASVGEQTAFSSFLFTHNIQVSFLAFTLGLTAGVGTGAVLFLNGVMLGSLAQVYAARGHAAWFWAWILPHGIPELTAIFLAGAAGLILGRGILAPRGLPRRVALRKESRVALQLVLGLLPILVVAGLIEGTISQIHPPQLSVATKIGFAITVGVGLYAWLGSAWLSPDAREQERASANRQADRGASSA